MICDYHCRIYETQEVGSPVWNTHCFLYFRFERGPGFRVRDERRSESDHRTKVDVRHSRDRYPESSKGKDVAVSQFDSADRVQVAVLGQQYSAVLSIAQYCWLTGFSIDGLHSV
jgi:hypothetical protein